MAFQCDLIQHRGAEGLAPASLGNILALYALITSQDIHSPPAVIGHGYGDCIAAVFASTFAAPGHPRPLETIYPIQTVTGASLCNK